MEEYTCTSEAIQALETIQLYKATCKHLENALNELGFPFSKKTIKTSKIHEFQLFIDNVEFCLQDVEFSFMVCRQQDSIVLLSSSSGFYSCEEEGSMKTRVQMLELCNSLNQNTPCNYYLKTFENGTPEILCHRASVIPYITEDEVLASYVTKKVYSFIRQLNCALKTLYG